MTTILIVLLLALAFIYINGFHDTANCIATVVATRALSPRQAIVLATVTNFAGALVGSAVVATMAHDLVDPTSISIYAIVGALLGAIAWNLLTWWWGLPTSSSHALIGGLCGAAITSTYEDWHEIVWAVPSGTHWWEGSGVLYKVLLPMVASPLLGFMAAYLAVGAFFLLLRGWPVTRVNSVFGRLQILSGGYIGFAHGNNDAQKTIGVVLMALVIATKSGSFDHLPHWLSFLKLHDAGPGAELQVGLWLRVICALALAAGTAAGGWRIIQTVGWKIAELKPIHGFAAETTAATVLTTAAWMGFPVSTTQTITAAVAGVGDTRRFQALHLPVVRKIIWVWLVTLPAAAILGHCFTLGLAWLGYK